MPLQTTGAISFNDITYEVTQGKSGSQISLNDNDARNISKILTGQISISDFYGKQVVGQLFNKGLNVVATWGGYVYCTSNSLDFSKFVLSDMSWLATVSGGYTGGYSTYVSNIGDVYSPAETNINYPGPTIITSTLATNSVATYDYGSNISANMYELKRMPNGNAVMVGQLYYGAAADANGIMTIFAPSVFAELASRRLAPGSSTVSITFNACGVDASSNVYALGETYNGTTGLTRGMVVKYTSTGPLAWQRVIANIDHHYHGNADSAGNAYTAMRVGTSLELYKYNTSGTVLIANKYSCSQIGLSGTFGESAAAHITETGNTYVFANGGSIFSIFKIDSSGNIASQLFFNISPALSTFGSSYSIWSDDIHVIINVNNSFTIKLNTMTTFSCVGFGYTITPSTAGYTWTTGVETTVSSTSSFTSATITPSSATTHMTAGTSASNPFTKQAI